MPINSFDSEYILIHDSEGSSFNMFCLLYENYQKNAKRRGRRFDLTPLEFYKLTKGRCHYCNKQPAQYLAFRIKMQLGDMAYVYNGIDRMNNDVGYVPSNCVSCCWKCNRAKGKMPYQEFIDRNK